MYPKTLDKVEVMGLDETRDQASKIVRIERKYDPNSSMSLKTGDLTLETINRLIEEGEKDAEFI